MRGAYRAEVKDARRGGLIVLADPATDPATLHALADGYAEQGYQTLALAAPSSLDEALTELGAALQELAPPVFVLGYGAGGAAAWRAAFRLEGIAAISCVGGAPFHLPSEPPRVPVLLHVARRDPELAPAAVDALAAAAPDLPIHRYDADAAFTAGNGSGSDAARLMRLRTLQLFHRASGARGEGETG